MSEYAKIRSDVFEDGWEALYEQGECEVRLTVYSPPDEVTHAGRYWVVFFDNLEDAERDTPRILGILRPPASPPPTSDTGEAATTEPEVPADE